MTSDRSFLSFSYLFVPPLSSPQAAEVKDGVFCPSVPANQTKAFSASAAAAAPSLCVTLILEKTTPSSAAQGTDPLWISSSLLDLSCLSLFFRCCCERSCNAVPTRPNHARTSGQVSKSAGAGHENRYETRIIPVKIQLSVSPSSENFFTWSSVHLSSLLTWSLSFTFPIKMYNTPSLLINWTALSINMI